MSSNKSKIYSRGNFLFCVVFLLNVVFIEGTTVTFFRDNEYQDILFQSEAQLECKNLPNHVTSKISSVQTEGCIVFYAVRDCSPTDRINFQVMTIGSGEKATLTEYNFQLAIRSFRRCSMTVNETNVETFRNPISRIPLNKFKLTHNECTPVIKSSELKGPTFLKTDGCLIAYSSYSCNSPGWMIYPHANTSNVAYFSLSFYSTGIRSIRACNESRRTGEIKFFQNGNSSEEGKLLFQHSISHEECSPILASSKDKISSLWSSDCVMLYTSLDCTVIPYSYYSLRLEPNKITNLWLHEGFQNNDARTFRLCSPTEGGEKSKVTFYKTESGWFSDSTIQITTFTAGDLCGCHYLYTAPEWMVNLGTCVELYHDSYCSNWGRTIPGGENPASRNPTREFISPDSYHYHNNFYSFKLCQVFPSCFNVTVTAFKIQMKTNFTEDLVLKNVQKVEMAVNDLFLNNGSATIYKEYIVNRRITETVSVERVESVTGMHSFTLEASTHGKFETGIPLFVKGKLDAGLRTAYTYHRSSTDTEANKKVISEEKEFGISQKIQVPPCTAYEVRSFVRVANLPMDYEVFVEVGGKAGNDKISKKMLKQYLPSDLEYIEDLDEFTVIAKGQGQIKARYGINSVFSGVGKAIEGCKANLC